MRLNPCSEFIAAEGGAHPWCDRCGWRSDVHAPALGPCDVTACERRAVVVRGELADFYFCAEHDDGVDVPELVSEEAP